MEKGQMRCDCNVSVRPEGTSELGREDRDQEHELDQRRAPGASPTRSSARWKRCATGETARAIHAPLGRGCRQDHADAREGVLARLPLLSPTPICCPWIRASSWTKCAPAVRNSPARSATGSCATSAVTPYDASVLAERPRARRLLRRRRPRARKPKNVANWVINDLLSALTAADKVDRRLPDLPVRAR